MKPFAQQTYYELLEVPPTASDEDIRAAHQRLMELYSPDSVAVYALGDPDQVDALRERMTEAMEMLTDAELRLEYDRSIGLPTERLAKATSAAAAQDKTDSAARVAEALATAAAALAKAAGAVDAERVEAESRLKIAASVSEEEAPPPSAPPGRSEERMRAEEPKRQESSGKDASGAASEPVMVGGMAVVDAFRASFNRSLSFVYVPTGPLRGQGRGNAVSASPTPVEEPRPAMEAATPPVASTPNAGVVASAASEATVAPVTAPSVTETVTVVASPDRAPEPGSATPEPAREEVVASAPAPVVDAAASTPATAATVREDTPAVVAATDAEASAVTAPPEPGTGTPPEAVAASASPAPGEPVSAPGG
ncbi:DnaJ domain-containing protein, partial [Corallococcus llansteffanensis]